MSDILEIETDRLILRHPTIDDAETITRAKQDIWPELQQWMSWSSDGQEKLDATIDFIQGKIGKNSLIGFLKDTGEFALMSGLTPQTAPDEYETGYWAAKNQRGKGYAAEATNAAIRFAFEQLKAKVIHISYFSGNEKSMRIIEKLGFTNEVIDKNARVSFLDRSIQDSHKFTMTDISALPELNYSWRGKW